MLAALVLAALVGGWEAYVDFGGVDPIILPSPHAVAQALYDDRGILWSNLLVTAREIGLGMVIALLAGLLVAIAMHFSRTTRRAIYPIAVASQAVPVVLIAPLLVFWWGFGVTPKLFVIGLVCFFPVLVTTVDALRSVDPDQLKLLRTLGASRWQAFLYAEAPAALPAALSGARIAISVAAIGSVLAELTGSTAGLGHLSQTGQNQLDSPLAFAAILVLASFVVVLFFVLSLAERRLAWWANDKPAGGAP